MDFGSNEFKMALDTKTYPSYLRKPKAMEFTNPRMGTIYVNEYYSEFLELMRLALDIIPSGSLKAQRFDQRLT